MDKEEGEMSDDSLTFDDQPNKQLNDHDADAGYTLLFRPANNGVVMQKVETIDASKLEERAKRFGLNLNESKVVTKKQIEDLYKNLDITEDNERHFRFDTIHLKGVSGLTTREVFDYLEDYKPVSLEWVDTASCNIICQDHISAALAILIHSREIKSDVIKDIAMATPPYFWREGFPHPKKDLILMRFATHGDKKDSSKVKSYGPSNPSPAETMDVDGAPSKNPWGDLCKSWGVYDHQEHIRLPPNSEPLADRLHQPIIKPRNKKLAERLGKRRISSQSSDESDSSDSKWTRKSKVPRMRMHADDEEGKKAKPPNPLTVVKEEPTDYSSLSIEIANDETEELSARHHMRTLSEKFSSNIKHRLGDVSLEMSKPSVHSRLGNIVMVNNENEKESSDSEVSLKETVMSKVQKVSNKADRGQSVWKRLESKKKDSPKDLRQSIKTSKKSLDLRKKIGKSCRGRSPLRIEIDNEYYESD